MEEEFGREELLEEANKLCEHCKGCPHFSVTCDVCDGFVERYECDLLWNERVEEAGEEDDEYVPRGDEGLLAVAEYDKEGNITFFDIYDSYPEGCPREKGVQE